MTNMPLNRSYNNPGLPITRAWPGNGYPGYPLPGSGWVGANLPTSFHKWEFTLQIEIILIISLVELHAAYFFLTIIPLFGQVSSYISITDTKIWLATITNLTLSNLKNRKSLQRYLIFIPPLSMYIVLLRVLKIVLLRLCVFFHSFHFFPSK